LPTIKELNEYVNREAAFVKPLLAEVAQVVVGQERFIQRILLALLTNGHLLVEGVPGLAKTLTIRTLAATLDTSFRRIQFTPDLLPADIVGTLIYQQSSGQFEPRFGPIFANLILADEINRAPAKVQSALLECMEERQVTIGDTTYPLDDPFVVMATQNPIEQEGTYPLPEAQLDRFLFKVVIGYLKRDEERLMLERMSGPRPAPARPVLQPAALIKARQVIEEIYVDDKIKDYVLDIIGATRKPAEMGLKRLESLIEFGASPRATLALVRTAKALAFLEGRGFVMPDDIKALAADVLRHRIILSFEAQTQAITTTQIIGQILKQVPVP